MNHFGPNRLLNLPSQSNVNTVATLRLSNGKTKLLVATVNGRIYACEFVDGEPVVYQVPFSNIERGSDIGSIDAFNRSEVNDDFCVGITIQKRNPDRSRSSFLIIYTEPDPDQHELDLNSLARNAQLIQLHYRNHHLRGTSIIDFAKSCFEDVWLLSGDDLGVHMMRKHPVQDIYLEVDTGEYFPEFFQIPDIILWIDIKYTADCQRRLTAYGCATGLVKFYLINTLTNTCMMNFKKHFQTPVTMVLLFQLDEPLRNRPRTRMFENSPPYTSTNLCKDIFNLLIVKVHGCSLFMDVTRWMTPLMYFPKAEKFGACSCAAVADINRDGKLEILIGTASNELLVYKFKEMNWKFDSHYKFLDPIQCITYTDLSGDGIKDLVVVSKLGVNIMQRNPEEVERFRNRYSRR